MVEMFSVVLNMSITASLCIIVVYILRSMLRRVPKIYSYLLWSIVAFRLVCPIALESNYGLVSNPFQKGNEVVEARQEETRSSIHTKIVSLQETVRVRL